MWGVDPAIKSKIVGDEIETGSFVSGKTCTGSENNLFLLRGLH